MISRKLNLIRFIILVALASTLCAACSDVTAPALKDGYYTAEAASLDSHGWKEFVSIYVSNGRIVTVEYNAKNASGFIKSWDMEYMRIMNATSGTYPNKYAREYAAELLYKQQTEGIDVITGATHSFSSFTRLVEAVLAKAQAGDKYVAFVDIPDSE